MVSTGENPVDPDLNNSVKHGAAGKSNLLGAPEEAFDRTIIRAAVHVWAAVAFLLLWLQFSYVRELLRAQDWQIYSLYFLAVGGVATRYLTGIRYGRERWHRISFDGLTILFISLGVSLSGGIRSDLWLFYFIFVIAETIAASARGFLITDGVAILSYVVATWPREGWSQQELERLATRVFFLILVASIARSIAGAERERQEDIGALRETLAASEERRRLARDLHDGVGHILTRVILGLEMTRRQIRTDPDGAETGLQAQTGDLRTAMGEMRQIVSTLRAETGALTLAEALRSIVRGLDSAGGPKVELQLPDHPLPLSPPRQYHLSRVVQEALTNCIRHSGASTATVRVEVQAHAVMGERVILEVIDDGSGFDVDQTAPGHGLPGMAERLAPYGGKVTIESAPGKGTRVRAELPADSPLRGVGAW